MSPTETVPTTAGAEMSTSELLADLRRYIRPDPPALSLPPRMFTSPEIYERERERIFGRSWILVGHASQLANAGDYLALDIADEPVVVTRDQRGRLHALSPICRHRMMPLVESGCGNVRDFTCSYHLWRYGLDGSLIAATHMRDNSDFNPAECRLPTFAVQQWHGLVFVNLDAGAPSFAGDLAVVDAEMANYRLDEMVQVSTWTEEWRCNWKIAVENSHENYHALGFHPQTVKPLMTGGIDMNVHIDSPLVTRLISPSGNPFEVRFLPLTEAERRVMYSFRLFPCAAVATFGESIAWISLFPVSSDRTQVRGGTLMPAAALDGADLSAIRAEVEAITSVINSEDRRGLEAVQRTVGSRFLERGHLSPKEPGVVAFYRNLALALTGYDDVAR